MGADFVLVADLFHGVSRFLLGMLPGIPPGHQLPADFDLVHA